MSKVRFAAAGLDHGPVVHNHCQRAGKLPGNGHGEVVPPPGDERDFDPACSGLGNRSPVAFGERGLVIQQRAIDVQCNQANRHSSDCTVTGPRSAIVRKYRCAASRSGIRIPRREDMLKVQESSSRQGEKAGFPPLSHSPT